MGLGMIGRGIARAAASSGELELVAAIDPAPDLAHKRLVDLVPGAPPGLRVEADPARALRLLRGGVLLHSGGSRLKDVLGPVEQAVRAGAHVVSTCEELAFPWLSHEQQADALDELARKHEVAVLGTGACLGFVLDRLVATAGGACGEVRHARAVRVADFARCPTCCSGAPAWG